MKLIINVLLLATFLFTFDISSFADSVVLKAVVFKPSTGGGLPRTGQTTSYPPPALCYDDGYYQKGYSGTHYTGNGNNTITDNATGLMWINDMTLVPGTWTSLDWSTAITKAHSLDYAGHSDWRVPNAAELLSILNYSKQYHAIGDGASSTSPWINTLSYWGCWTSTSTCVNGTTYAFYVLLTNVYGNYILNWQYKTFAADVRLVRGP